MLRKISLVCALSVALCATVSTGALAADTTAPATGTTTPAPIVTTLDPVVCMSNLEDQREFALQAAYETYATVRMNSVTTDSATVQAAFKTKSDADTAALQTYLKSAKDAFAARQVALKAAWSMTDRKARKAAIKAAWDGFRSADKAGHKALEASRKAAEDQWKTAVSTAEAALKDANKISEKQWTDARKAAWDKFNTDKKACKGDVVKDETTTKE